MRALFRNWNNPFFAYNTSSFKSSSTHSDHLSFDARGHTKLFSQDVFKQKGFKQKLNVPVNWKKPDPSNIIFIVSTLKKGFVTADYWKGNFEFWKASYAWLKTTNLQKLSWVNFGQHAIFSILPPSPFPAQATYWAYLEGEEGGLLGFSYGSCQCNQGVLGLFLL